MRKERVIIIGASSGIGAELAKIFSRKGCDVGIAARRLNLLKEVKDGNPGVKFVKVIDLARPDEAAKFFLELVNEMGGVDLVVISSGTGHINPTLDWAKEKETIDVNVAGFTAIASAAMNLFIKAKSGHLVGISSIAALCGSSESPSYSASKAYMSNYLEGLRFKVRKISDDIIVTDIKPGFVDTVMAKGDGIFWSAKVDKAAEQIYGAIKQRRSHAVITRRWNLIYILLKVLPKRVLEKIF